MLKMRKLGCLLVAVMFACVMMLSGCGGATAPAAGTTQAAAAATQAAAADTKAADANAASQLPPYELNCYFLAPQAKDLPLVQDEINKILKEKINATIKLNYFWWDAYQQKQQLVVASGEKIDTMFSPSWWGYNDFVAKQAWLPLDDLLAKYGQDIKKNIDPAYLKAPVINGKLYAIPTAKDMFGNGGFIFNKELLDKYKFDVSTIKQPEDIEPWLQTIKEKEPGVIPFLSSQGDQTYYFAMDWMGSCTGTADIPVGFLKTDGDVKVINQLESDIYKRLFKLNRSWYQKGYINKDVATMQDGTPSKKSKKVFAWTEQLKPGKADELKGQFGYDLVQADAWKGVQEYTTTPDLCNSQLVITRTSKDPARAMMFINLLFSDKKLKNLLSWGIEGKHYKKIGDNQIDFADGVTADNSGYYGTAQWSMGGSQFLDYLWASEAPDKWKKMAEFNASAKPMKTIGWTYDSTNVKSEVAAIQAIGQNQIRPLAEGIVDYDSYYPKLKAALEKAGIQKVIDDSQKQINDFIAKQK